MDIVELGRAALRERWVEWLMLSSGYFARAVIAAGHGMLLWLHGYSREPQSEQFGTALLIALAGVCAGAEGKNGCRNRAFQVELGKFRVPLELLAQRYRRR
jgi:hypothetical protein